MKRTGGLKRSGYPRRVGLRRLGRQARREQAAKERFKVLVRERAGYRCERCGSTYQPHAHHMRRTSRGGPPEVKHDPSIGALLCGGQGGCHQLVHDHVVDDWREWFR